MPVAQSCLTQSMATPWTVICQAPLSMGFSRQEYWSGLLFPLPGDLPDPRIEPGVSCIDRQIDTFTTGPHGKPALSLSTCMVKLNRDLAEQDMKRRLKYLQQFWLCSHQCNTSCFPNRDLGTLRLQGCVSLPSHPFLNWIVFPLWVNLNWLTDPGFIWAFYKSLLRKVFGMEILKVHIHLDK